MSIDDRRPNRLSDDEWDGITQGVCHLFINTLSTIFGTNAWACNFLKWDGGREVVNGHTKYRYSETNDRKV